MKARKTISVEALTQKINYRIANSPAERSAERLELASFLSNILHETGNYHGYNFSQWLNGGHDRWIAAGQPEDKTEFLGDISRVFFYSGPQKKTLNVKDFPLKLK